MPNGNKPTLEEIMADYQTAMDAFGELERAYQVQIEDIERSDPPLTDEQKTQRNKLVAAQKKCRGQMTKISWATLEKLNDLDEVKRLKSAFDSVNVELKGSLEDVKHIEKVAAATVKVLAAVAEVAAKLAKYAV
jgi:hypothetical protein